MARKKPVAKADAASTQLQAYLDEVSAYEREFAKWEKRVDKIIKRYRDEKRETESVAKFNILWSNVQVLVPATFARIPQPDVSRRFRDQDPTGRVAALILERALDFEIQHYPDYAATMKESVLDRFLGGRGTAWVRYEPHFKEVAQAAESAEVGAQITEDVEVEEPEEQLDYECAPVDYVHWKDYGHSVARTWEEVNCAWRWVYMSEGAVLERFGAEIAKKLPYDASPQDTNKTQEKSDIKKQAKVCELWDKERGVAVWFSKSMKEIIEEVADPLKLSEFFPCPRPLFATLTNGTLVPVPDFTLYQDQARSLDLLADRIDGLAGMLQIKGVYDASADSALARLFTEGNNGTLLPVKNWAAFAEKNGLKGQIDVYDLTPIVKALEAAYMAAENVKNQIYEIMGIADIVRGSSDPNETLGAQELKGQYASMRLNAMKADVSRYATDILRLKAQVMCSKFNPQTLAAIGAVEQLNEADKPFVSAAMALLVGTERMTDPEAEAPNPMRAFRIEVNADSMVQMNEQEEKTSRMEFLTANGTFMDKATQMVAQAGAAAPIITPLIMEMWKFGVTGFKVGKSIEGAFDEAADKLKQLAANPPPPQPDPKVAAEQAKIAQAAQEAQHAQRMSEQVALHEKALAERQQAHDEEIARREAAAEQQKMRDEALARDNELRQKHASEMRDLRVSADNELRKEALKVAGQIEVAKITAGAKAASDAAKAKQDGERQAEEQKQAQNEGDDARKIMESLLETQSKLLESISAPKEVTRDSSGRVSGIRVIK